MKKYILKWLFKWVFKETFEILAKKIEQQQVQIMNLKEQITFYQMKGKIK